jgi:dUTPase
MENKTKRFYKVKETVWVVGEKKEGRIKSINKETLEVVVTIKEDKEIKELTLKMWEIDKLKYKAKEELVSKKRGNRLPTVYFAKVRNTAIIPSKRDEDAGYDLYADIEPKNVDGHVVYELLVPALKTTLVPTGIAMALPKTHYFNCKHERGSTGKISLSVLAGVVDSGYRGEVFVALTPLHKDVLITSEVTETVVEGDVILYPYSKAIAQGTIDLVPQVNIEVIKFEDLANIKSERGATKLGQSGK